MPQMYFGGGKLPGQAEYSEKIVDQCALQMKRRGFKVRPNKPFIVASFDVDGTLVVTESGSTFARTGDDWKLLPGVSSLKSRLKQLSEENPDHQCVCVLFTNQGGTISRPDSKSYIKLQTKLQGICRELGCVDLAFAALKADGTSQSKYRKPNTGMMDLLSTLVSEPIDMDKSFYVGDAAGRADDHSSDDINFAKNVGIPFLLPEQYFTHGDMKETLNGEPSSKEESKSENLQKEPKLEDPKSEDPKSEVPQKDSKLKAPKLKASKSEAPKLKAPKLKAPKLKAPKLKAPKLKAPEAPQSQSDNNSEPMPKRRKENTP